MKKSILCVLLAAVMTLSLCACGNQAETVPSASPSASPSPIPEASPDPSKTNIVIETEYGEIKAELYPEVAPITVANFQQLVEKGFYDGLTFHRIIDGFMIQGGDPKGNGTGGSDKKIKGEFSSNGVQNDLKHERGVLSMARSMNPNSASSQFFIMHADAPHLDGEYAAFGRVVDGIEVVDEIVKNAEVEDFNGTVLGKNQPKINRIYVIK